MMLTSSTSAGCNGVRCCSGSLHCASIDLPAPTGQLLEPRYTNLTMLPDYQTVNG
jgi:hypothetical protein